MRFNLKFIAFLLLTVSLTFSCDTGDGNDSKDSNTVTIPAASFTGNPASGEFPLVVSFTDQSTGWPSNWNWNFGDSKASTQQNPTHTYTAAGTYTVSLTATNAAGTDTETKTGYITVTTPPDPGVTPVLDTIMPIGAGYGATITLKGEQFGDGSLYKSTVMFDSVAAVTYPSWDDDEIEVVVPTFDPPIATQVEVKVIVGSRESGTITFYRQDKKVSLLTLNTSCNWQPCWADNNTIYFASTMGTGGNFNIWYMDDDGDNLTQRTFHITGHTDMPAVYGPTLYYRSSHEGAVDIFINCSCLPGMVA